MAALIANITDIIANYGTHSESNPLPAGSYVTPAIPSSSPWITVDAGSSEDATATMQINSTGSRDTIHLTKVVFTDKESFTNWDDVFSPQYSTSNDYATIMNTNSDVLTISSDTLTISFKKYTGSSSVDLPFTIYFHIKHEGNHYYCKIDPTVKITNA